MSGAAVVLATARCLDAIGLMGQMSGAAVVLASARSLDAIRSNRQMSGAWKGARETLPLEMRRCSQNRSWLV
jgi:hypothetical protein